MPCRRSVVHAMLILFVLAAIGRAETTVDLLAGGKLSVYSDRNEKATSGTTVEMKQEDGVLSVSFHVPEHPALRYSYAGFGVALPKTPGFAPQTLEMDLRKTAEAPQPFGLTVRTSTGKSYRREIAGYGQVTEDWRTIRIPLSDLAVPEDERANINAIRMTVASHNVKDDIPLQAGTLFLRNLRLTDRAAEGVVKVPDYRAILAARKPVTRPPGHAAWLYGTDENYLKQIAGFNAASAVPINLLFVSTASLSFKASGAGVTPFKEDLRWYLDRKPEGVEVHAMIAGDGRELGRLSFADQEKLAETIARQVNETEGLDGIHFDIEPYVIEDLPFYVAIKRSCTKPMSVALNKWDEHILWVADFPVVMAYGKNKDPKAYAESALSMIRAFADDSVKAQRTFYAGVVLAHTNLEYEYEEHAATGQRTYTGFKMEDYTRAILDRLAAEPKSAWYGGVSVWAFMPEKSQTHREWMKRPRAVKPECLEQLRTYSQNLRQGG